MSNVARVRDSHPAHLATRDTDFCRNLLLARGLGFRTLVHMADDGDSGACEGDHIAPEGLGGDPDQSGCAQKVGVISANRQHKEQLDSEADAFMGWADTV